MKERQANDLASQAKALLTGASHAIGLPRDLQAIETELGAEGADQWATAALSSLTPEQYLAVRYVLAKQRMDLGSVLPVIVQQLRALFEQAAVNSKSRGAGLSEDKTSKAQSREAIVLKLRKTIPEHRLQKVRLDSVNRLLVAEGHSFQVSQTYLSRLEDKYRNELVEVSHSNRPDSNEKGSSAS